MEPLFERREYPEGVQYIQVPQPVPGLVYYVRRIDEADQIYYAQQVFQPLSGTNPQNTNAQIIMSNPQSNLALGVGGPGTEAFNLHLGITITSLFIPGLIYLIGFPFCYLQMKKFIEEDMHSTPSLMPKYQAYVGVGWTTYVIHIILTVTLFTFYLSVFGIIALILFVCLHFAFSIIIIAVGADLITNARMLLASGGAITGVAVVNTTVVSPPFE